MEYSLHATFSPLGMAKTKVGSATTFAYPTFVQSDRPTDIPGQFFVRVTVVQVEWVPASMPA